MGLVNVAVTPSIMSTGLSARSKEYQNQHYTLTTQSNCEKTTSQYLCCIFNKQNETFVSFSVFVFFFSPSGIRLFFT